MMEEVAPQDHHLEADPRSPASTHPPVPPNLPDDHIPAPPFSPTSPHPPVPPNSPTSDIIEDDTQYSEEELESSLTTTSLPLRRKHSREYSPDIPPLPKRRKTHHHRDLPSSPAPTILSTTPPLLYHLYHLSRLRLEYQQSQKPIPPPPASRGPKKRKVRFAPTNPSRRPRPRPHKTPATDDDGETEVQEKKPWYTLSRTEDFVGPSYQEEFVRRRLLELEESLVRLSGDQWFKGVWEREVEERLWEEFGGRGKEDAGVGVEQEEEEEVKTEDENLEDESTEDVGEGEEDTELEENEVTEDEDDDLPGEEKHHHTPPTSRSSSLALNANVSTTLPLNTSAQPINSSSPLPSSPAAAATSTAAKAANNCIHCKKNKKGCDRLLPTCSRCIKLGKGCDYDLRKLGELKFKREGPVGGIGGGRYGEDMEEGGVEWGDEAWQ